MNYLFNDIKGKMRN